MDYRSAPGINENDMSIIQRTDYATKAIKQGQYVTWRGRTGRAKSPILQGAQLSASLFSYEEDGTLNEVAFSGWKKFLDNVEIAIGTSKNLPENWNELLIYAGNWHSYSDDAKYVFYIIRGNGDRRYICGYNSGSGANYADFKITSNETKIQNSSSVYNGSNYVPYVLGYYR